MRAAGLQETVTPITGPIEDDPVSGGEESASSYFELEVYGLDTF